MEVEKKEFRLIKQTLLIKQHLIFRHYCHRQPELYESPGSSQYSTGSNIRSLRDIKEAKQDEICAPNQDTRLEAQLLQTGDQNGLAVSEDGVLSGLDKIKYDNIVTPNK